MTKSVVLGFSGGIDSHTAAKILMAEGYHVVLATIDTIGDKAMLHKAEAWNEERRAYGDELVLACTSSQIDSLLREPQVSSYDYNTVRALAEGKVDSFLGFRIIRTELLPLDAETGERSCLAWVKSKAQFGIWDDFKVKISVRDDLDEALQIRAKFACGATRLQEEAFVKIQCSES